MKLTKLCVAVALVAGAASATALPVTAAIPAGFIDFSDNSAESLVDRNSNGLLDVGDSLRGIFSIDNITGSGPQVAIGAGTAYDELTGLFQVKVLTKTATASPGLFNYTFGFDSAFGQGANVSFVFYDDPAKNFARLNCPTNTMASCESTATGGSVLFTAGFTGAGDFQSAANANENPGAGANLPLNTPLGTFGIGVNLITNNSGFVFNQVSCFNPVTGLLSVVDFCGQGGILATGRVLQGTNTPFDIFDNVDINANRVPEPGSLALVGVALLGLGLRKSNKSTKKTS